MTPLILVTCVLKLVTFTFLLCGCAVWRPMPFGDVRARRAASLPETYLHYYDYPAPNLSGEVIFEKTTKHYVLRRVEIPLSLPPELIPENLEALKKEIEELSRTDRKTSDDRKLQYTNRIDFYLPKNFPPKDGPALGVAGKPGDKRPVILISPILGGNMVVDHFANYYAGRGYLAALVHRKRLSWAEDEDMKSIEDYMRTSVIRLRQAVDWLEAQPEVDPVRIGAFGISYGAVLHSVLAAVELRIRYHVLAMPAAPIPDVIVHCPDKAITKLMKKAREKYGWTDEEIHARLKKVILTDPIYLASYVPRERVKVYIAVFDRVVGARRSWKLWRAMGRPALDLLPFGHYGGVLTLPYLQTRSYAAFKRHLRANPHPYPLPVRERGG